VTARRYVVIAAAADDEVVDRLAAALAPRNIAFVHDRSAPGSGDWARHVAGMARRCDRLVLVWSPATAQQAVWAPLAADAAARLRLLLVVAEKVAMPAALADVPRVDLSRWRGSPDYPGIARLAALLADDGPCSGSLVQRLRHRVRRRLALLSGTFGICLPCALFAFNVFGAQESVCSFEALSDRCGEWQLGGRPTREERTAWERLDRSDPAALQGFIAGHPDGVYHGAAADLLEACRPVPREEWVPHRSTVGVMVSRFEATAPSEAGARRRALRLAQEEATRSCTAHGFNDGFRFDGRLELRLDSVGCSDLGGRFGCDAQGWAICGMQRAQGGKRLVCSGRTSVAKATGEG
jgi:hypothetical protein